MLGHVLRKSHIVTRGSDLFHSFSYFGVSVYILHIIFVLDVFLGLSEY